MQPKTLLAVLSVAIAASARPNPAPAATTSSCDAPNVVECCDSISTNGTGLGCILSTLNFLDPTCASSQSLACCNGSQTGLVNVQLGCIPIGVAG